MNASRNHRLHSLKRGQALPAAVIILSVLLVLGFVFLGLLNRNIGQVRISNRRATAQDLAESGIRYMHAQTINSEAKGDWMPELVQIPAGGDFTRDPDILYLRPGTGFPLPGAPTVDDKGGPDGLGPYSRLEYRDGRSLVRLRWAAGDPNNLAPSPVGSLREPGKVKNYLILESVGRSGRVNLNDPTTLTAAGGVQFRNYANAAAFAAAFSDMKEKDNQTITSRKLIAFADIGIINHAMFITNKDDVSRPADLGADMQNGAYFGATPVTMPIRFGGTVPAGGGQTVSGGGSVWSNADLRFFGSVDLILNQGLGDNLFVAGSMIGADSADTLHMIRTKGDDSVTVDNDDIQVTNGGALLNGGPVAGSLDSGNGNWHTFGGIMRDGSRSSDIAGFPRSVGRKEPPSFLFNDPVTGINSYLNLCRNSGVIGVRGPTGRFGHGGNPYINNIADLQMRSDESGREDAGGEESPLYDWLNPNNGQPTSAWTGPYYVPPGATLRFTWDGFTITRDGRAPANQRTWRRPDGSDSGLTSLRYRIGVSGGVTYLINSLTNPGDIEAANPVWTNGYVFGGVLYFEGNVRVRGIIPTDQQLTVLSMGIIYIEGSITKGITIDSAGTRLNRPSKSTLMLMAKDYVTVNTTQFFGMDNGQGLNEVQESADPREGNALRMAAAGGSIGLINEFVLNDTTVAGRPAINSADPSTWRPYLVDFRHPVGGGPMIPNLLLSQAMDNGPASFSFIGLDVNTGLATPTFNFEMDANNAAAPPYTLGTWGPVKGLGSQAWQRYPQFETSAHPLLDPTTADPATLWSGSTLTSAGSTGTYQLLVGGITNTYSIYPTNLGMGTTNDYVLRRAAITPHDIRIEASVYAEEGSFFVIPGRWFNQNPNDRRDTYVGLGATPAIRAAERLRLYGATPQTPFYGEPLDVKVTIVGAVSQNMPPAISAQTEYMRKWGWIPREHGASGELIPTVHVPIGYDVTAGNEWVPNLTIIYDPVLATGRYSGYQNVAGSFVRYRRVVPDPVNNPAFTIDYPLPPMPRLPVSPTLAYFGEVNP